jgi:nitric oxide reductase activation protein
VDRKTGEDPTENIFLRKEKRIRRISTALLVDMSASTEKRVPLSENSTALFKENVFGSSRPHNPQSVFEKKIIDIEIDSLVVIMEALDALNDEYAIFGFSGSGRDNVDFYLIKEFGDPYSDLLKRRISGIRPKESTRMGTAIRHATDKLKDLDTDQRLLIILSDGYPQDHDYGEDRSSEEYGLHDTMMAMLEAKREGIRPFCLTVDQSGNDYLRKMCDPANYLVIQDAYSLPEVLPKVVESLMV